MSGRSASKRSYAWTLAPLTIAVVIVATPATVGLSLYQLTKNPTFRPLSVSREEIWYLQGTGNPLIVTIAMPAAYTETQTDAYAEYIHRAIRAKGVQPKVVTVQTSEKSGQVEYQIGSNLVGPFSLGTAIDGVQAAVDAYWRQPETSEDNAQ